MTNKIIIHLVNKEQGKQPFLDASSDCLEIDEKVNNLTERLNDAFRKDEKVLKAEFKEDIKVFQEKSRKYIDKNSQDNFIDFSIKSIERMVDLLKGKNLATGGYFVFIDYIYRNINYVGVFMVRDIEEIIFKKSKGDTNYTVNTTTIVNTNKLAMAVRIDKSKLLKNELRYLHFTYRQSHQSDYFIDWIEAELADKSIDDSKALIHLINKLLENEFPINPETNERYESQEFRKHLLNHINSTGRIVRVKELSMNYWGNEDFLINKADELGIDFSNEFQADEKIIKRLNAYDIKSGKVRLIFSQKDIDEGVVFKGDDNQIIINSEELSKAFDELQ
jgi:nucleoid-associated protein